MMKYAFVNANGVVVNLISGALTESEQARFLSDYAALFGAVACVEVSAETAVWIGGSYTDGQFIPALEPAPEPLPEPLPEPQPEPEA